MSTQTLLHLLPASHTHVWMYLYVPPRFDRSSDALQPFGAIQSALCLSFLTLINNTDYADYNDILDQPSSRTPFFVCAFQQDFHVERQRHMGPSRALIVPRTNATNNQFSPQTKEKRARKDLLSLFFLPCVGTIGEKLIPRRMTGSDEVIMDPRSPLHALLMLSWSLLFHPGVRISSGKALALVTSTNVHAKIPS